jgi:hypothetical protein
MSLGSDMSSKADPACAVPSCLHLPGSDEQVAVPAFFEMN